MIDGLFRLVRFLVDGCLLGWESLTFRGRGFRVILWLGSLAAPQARLLRKLITIERFRKATEAAGRVRALHLPVLLTDGRSEYSKPGQVPLVFVPGLSAEPFPSRSRFAWADEFESHYETIRSEFLQVARQEGVRPYHPPELLGRHVVHHWNTFFLADQLGVARPDNIARCPRTWELLNGLPRAETSNMTMFSVLQPHSLITSHTGWCNLFIRVHLTLVNREPSKAAINVGEEVRGWEEGRLLFLDDSFRHQAWNSSDHPRVVLFFDVWHPDLADDEVVELRRLYREFRADPGFRRMSEKMAKIEARTAARTFDLER